MVGEVIGKVVGGCKDLETQTSLGCSGSGEATLGEYVVVKDAEDGGRGWSM